ncbi:MAG: ribbon-helix-helix domain-containing protein [Treponema sp.]|jgi:hypothetical protein|nr:ribbon-helix-helix domain-containing protein [Treponema sp.]
MSVDFARTSHITSVRLPGNTRNILLILARAKNMTKSEIIIEALERYYEQEENGIDSYTMGLPFFGKYGSGKGDLSTMYKQRIKEKIRVKYNK